MSSNLYRLIPNMDTLMQDDRIKALMNLHGKKTVLDSLDVQLESIRNAIKKGAAEDEINKLIDQVIEVVAEGFDKNKRDNFKGVINATGVVLHTNLGRAPMSQKMVQSAVDKMSGYSNLEYDLKGGKRGERYAHVEELICKITGAEAALVVNNNAAAALLMLAAVGDKGEVIVSRGEQVEIGGKFRVPDIMDLSGCKRIEVGTTNKTRIQDYADRITEDTKALLKVHTSNFKIEGFTESTSREELVALGREKNIPVIEDLGSGILIDLSQYGLKKEPTVQDSIASGIDLVSFSGDKLLGGPQAGIIVGKRQLVEKCKRHPFTRAMRIDKFTVAVLEQLFQCYEDEYKAVAEVPIVRMLTESQDSILNRANKLVLELEHFKRGKLTYEIVNCESKAGGGSLPGEVIKSYGVEITLNSISTNDAAAALRLVDVPVVCRIVDEKLLFDMRTVFEEDIKRLAKAISEVVC